KEDDLAAREIVGLWRADLPCVARMKIMARAEAVGAARLPARERRPVRGNGAGFLEQFALSSGKRRLAGIDAAAWKREADAAHAMPVLAQDHQSAIAGLGDDRHERARAEMMIIGDDAAIGKLDLFERHFDIGRSRVDGSLIEDTPRFDRHACLHRYAGRRASSAAISSSICPSDPISNSTQ